MIRWPFVWRGVSASFLVLVFAGLLVFYVSPPRPLWHWVMRVEGESLLNERSPTGAWVQKAITADLASGIPAGPMLESERVGRTLVALKPLLVSQMEVPSGPTHSEVGIAGLGWCNHLNGFAAEVLSHRYKAQVIAVTGYPTRTSHSFARVWSNGWIYFDVWADEIVVFRATPKGAQFLFRHRTKRTLPAADEATLHRAYDNAGRSFVIDEKQPRLGDYFAYRIGNLIDHGGVLPRGASEAIAADNRFTGGTVYAPAPQIRHAAAREYVEGRIDQLSGKSGREHYLAAAALSNGPYKLAAEALANR